MTEDHGSTEPAPQKRSLFKALLKTIVFTIIFLIVIFTVMANIGGSGQMYREALEGFLAEATGYPARVETLNNMSFFPEVSFDFEGAVLYESGAAEVSVASAAKVALALDFWDMLLQTGKLRALQVEQVKARAGVFMDKPVAIEHIFIAETEAGDAAILIGKGKIGEYPVNVRVDMDVYGEGYQKSYGFGPERPFSLDTGAVSLTGISRDDPDGVVFDDLRLVFEGEEVMSGHIRLDGRMTGELTLAGHGSVLAPDINLQAAHSPELLPGKVSSSCFYAADFSEDSRLNRMLDYLNAAFFESGEEERASGFSLFSTGLELKIKPVCDPEIKKEDIELPFSLEQDITILIDNPA